MNIGSAARMTPVARPLPAARGAVSQAGSELKQAAAASKPAPAASNKGSVTSQVALGLATAAGAFFGKAAQGLGMVNVMSGTWNAYQDIKGLKEAGNVKKSDDYIRLGSDAALVAGGAAMLAGALVAPWLPLVGAGVAVAGALGRAFGVAKDDTRA